MTQSIELNFIQRGRGRPLVLVPGWSQTARFFQKQIDGLSDGFHVFALDMRGHGDSPKPPHGYRIARLARDLHDFLVQHDLEEITLAGHSMGASIIWSYLEQFGGARLSRLIFIDQAPVVTNVYGLGGHELEETGAAFTPDTLVATANAVKSDQAAAVAGFKSAFFSDAIDEGDVAFHRDETLKMPGEYAARLLVDHGMQDWRDVIQHVIPATGLPTLVIGGELATIFPPAASHWIARQIPHAEVVIFSAAERGSHFMFWENPEKFNAVVRAFLNS